MSSVAVLSLSDRGLVSSGLVFIGRDEPTAVDDVTPRGPAERRKWRIMKRRKRIIPMNRERDTIIDLEKDTVVHRYSILLTFLLLIYIYLFCLLLISYDLALFEEVI